MTKHLNIVLHIVMSVMDKRDAFNCHPSYCIILLKCNHLLQLKISGMMLPHRSWHTSSIHASVFNIIVRYLNIIIYLCGQQLIAATLQNISLFDVTDSGSKKRLNFITG